MTQDQVVQTVKDAISQSQSSVLKSFLQALVIDGGAIDQQVALRNEQAPQDAIMVTAWGAETKQFIQDIITKL